MIDHHADHKAHHPQLKVATLNFSGINTNPFEYDDGSERLTRLNETVQQLIATELPGLKEWTGAKIDKAYQKHRMSIAFGDKIELVEGKLPNKQQFQTIWRRWFEKSGIKDKLKDPTEQNINNLITMDYLFYRAVLAQVYELKDVQHIEQAIPQLNYEKLYKFIDESSNRPSCQLKTKQHLVIDYLHKFDLDVFFLQEAGSIGWEDAIPKDYNLVKNHDSVIIFRKSKLGHVQQNEMQAFGSILDFNNDSAYLFTDKNYLIISGHLKSNNTNVEQAAHMFQSLKKVQQEHKFLKIIIGIDANHLVKENEGFVGVPKTQEVPTSIKKRSFLQAQFKKSGLLVSEVKDQIITNQKITAFWIERIDGVPTKNEFLPNDAHPYDHYIVRATVQ